MRATIGLILVLLGACGPAFELVCDEETEPQVIVIESGELVPPPAETVVVDPPEHLRTEPDAGAGRHR